MYRVFEALDELNQTVEEAYGVPMTANCMVPRQTTLALLDDVRNAFPAELDDAQDVLDQRDQILDEAEREAYDVRRTATEEAERMVAEAEAKVDAMLRDAENRAHGMVARAREEADATTEAAQREYESVTSRAAAEADRLVESGNKAYERSVQEGLEEQNRLVSEAEVVRRAQEEAQRLIDSAHADSRQLRIDCDDYVDSKLSEFEQSLSGVMRIVSRDRAQLRKGAGAAGGYNADYGQDYE